MHAWWIEQRIGQRGGWKEIADSRTTDEIAIRKRLSQLRVTAAELQQTGVGGPKTLYRLVRSPAEIVKED